MAETLFFESTINNAGGSCTVRAYHDPATGRPTRVEADTTLPRAYALYIGLRDRSIGVTLTINKRNMRINVPPGIQNVLDMRCVEDVCNQNWMCILGVA